MRSWTIKALLGLSLLPLVGVAVWYVVSFVPHIGEIKQLSDRGIKSMENVNPSIYSFAEFDQSKVQIRSYAMRQVYYSLVYGKDKTPNASWHANAMLWYASSYIHFSDKEIFGLWAQCALFGCEHGINEIAQTYFKKDLRQLSERELASLIAVIRSPTVYAKGSEKNEEYTNMILEKLKMQNAFIKKQ